MHVFKHMRKTSDFRFCGFGGFLLVETLPQALANIHVLERTETLRLCDGKIMGVIHLSFSHVCRTI